MTEEIKETQQKCICQNENFKKFLIISAGTFVGAFCAMSLFAALHKPPMPVHVPMKYHGYMHQKMIKHHHFKKHDCDCPCHKVMMKKQMESKKELSDDVKKNDD